MDLKAICVFSALGFFLDDDTYYVGQKVLKPATKYVIDEQGNILSKEHYFKWYYNPKERALNQITEEFAHLFEQIL
ncbi:MAG TPA: asparagine synthetase B family protein, partial [Aquaticitalea sp.]|nr:asparagine synthetase B family protein [Aquaticitalea sp.]